MAEIIIKKTETSIDVKMDGIWTDDALSMLITGFITVLESSMKEGVDKEEAVLSILNDIKNILYEEIVNKK